MNIVEVDWQITFNTSLRYWNRLSEAAKAAFDAGYSQYTWNDLLYRLDTEDRTD